MIQVQIGADVQGAVNGINRVNQSLAKMPNASNQATTALSNLSRVAQDAPYGFIGIANNINPLLESFQRLKVSTGSTGGALKALGKELSGGGGLGLAIGIASSLLVVFGQKLFGAKSAADEAKDSAKSLSTAIEGIFKDVSKEVAEVNGLIAVLKAETETRDRKLSAIKELQKIQPEIFAGLKLEGQAVIGLDTAYKNYLNNLQNVIAAKIIQVKLEQKINELLQKQGVGSTIDMKGFLDGMRKLRTQGLQGGDKTIMEQLFAQEDKAAQEGEAVLQRQIDALFKQLIQYSQGIKVPELKVSDLKVRPEKIELAPYPFTQWNTDLMKVPKLDLKIDNSGIKAPGLSKSFIDALSTNKAQIKDMREELEKLISAGQFLGSTLADAFGNVFDAIATGGNAFKALGNAIKQVVLDLIKAAIQALIVKAIVGAFAPGAGAGLQLGGIGSFFGLPRRAGGGPVAAGNPYIVGENRAEIFVPSTSGRILPSTNLSGLAGMGGGGGAFSVRHSISGRELVLLISRENNSQNRY
jgi:hypothetical protein